jgi:hypothetical protein
MRVGDGDSSYRKKGSNRATDRQKRSAILEHSL